MSTPNHLLWTMFTSILNTENKLPRVLTYINIRLIRLQFLFRRDIFNHKDINLILFFIMALCVFLLMSIQMTISLP